MQTFLIRNINVVNEGKTVAADVLIRDEKIEKIAGAITFNGSTTEINGEGKYLLPGVIDDQVHFREPGLTHKATIYTESKAAVAGGVTSFMEMPNTVPPAFTLELLEEKYETARQTSLANYSFFIGTNNQNAADALAANAYKDRICGIKAFMGSSTGNLLVDNPLVLEKLFAESEMLIATHCEDERIIKANMQAAVESGRTLTAADHPVIRNAEACFESSFYAVQLAKKHGSRLHILHISTEKELQLFTNMLPLKDKRITAEVCVHHLHFTAADYTVQGNFIKCNPAIKAPHNREALWNALLDDRLDVIATDHAPHTLAEKQEPYLKAHAGVPLVQHSLPLMLYYVKQGRISLEKVVQKMSHAVADCFQVKNRGYIREGYQADLVIADMQAPLAVKKENILYKCGWSPFEDIDGKGTPFEFPASITHTFINGNLVYGKGQWNESVKGQRLLFDR
ncbi:dihydroorotase [Niabella drilacis]|uniref:Dihydroorotase n=1 Tax=Niabella drilacis (strain DSM 25811 / CCM 8410 / CCUG 62505 / LMG 26954 / E90) TaxID=1285928 RepID=A0A1G6KRM7_NIADE|nr:dihydroorotase [Niabella drilacis]SDC33710.1 dihydroorotase [Niabella drilacis]